VAVVGLALWLLSTLFGVRGLGLVPAVLLVIVGALIGRWVVRGVRGAAGPLGELIEASARVEAGEYGRQVTQRGPREVRALAGAFNAMSSRLAETDSRRRQLLADVGHELRTPLTVIQGNVEGMLDGVYPADREHLQRVLAETRQLERLIEDLRTMSLADAGALPLHREATAVGTLVTDSVAALEPQAAEAGIALTVVTDDVPELDLDPRRMRQVIANLVSNAIRHTLRGGSVRVSVSATGDGVLISVADTGTGMDAESASKAFDRFWKSPDSPGAGLGLPIARDLVRAHGGEVEMETAPGEGTTVRVRLPSAARVAPPQP
jgi:two-component system OmpR family sensor kinase/two-component system sensor histidine kinase BaeS